VGFLRRLRRLVPGGRLLDVGCGEGRHAIAAAKMGFEVVAIDYEPLAIRRAKRFASKHRAKGITFRQGNALDLPFARMSFDVVLDYGCLHHQRKSAWAAYKASLLRVLKPGGFYVLSVFSPRFRLFGGSRRRWHIARGAYRRYFTREDVCRVFGRDFERVEMWEETGGGAGFWHALMRRAP
jgi:SAM-dependent methyltransferase